MIDGNRRGNSIRMRRREAHEPIPPRLPPMTTIRRLSTRTWLATWSTSSIIGISLNIFPGGQRGETTMKGKSFRVSTMPGGPYRLIFDRSQPALPAIVQEQQKRPRFVPLLVSFRQEQQVVQRAAFRALVLVFPIECNDLRDLFSRLRTSVLFYLAEDCFDMLGVIGLQVAEQFFPIRNGSFLSGEQISLVQALPRVIQTGAKEEQADQQREEFVHVVWRSQGGTNARGQQHARLVRKLLFEQPGVDLFIPIGLRPRVMTYARIDH